MPAARGPLHTRICDMMGITHPVFGFNHSVPVTAAITLNGGIGVYGATRKTPDEIRLILRDIRDRVGDRPFGVDLVLPKGMPEHNNRALIEEQLPQRHRDFVAGIIEKYKVPKGSGPGSRSRFVRSEQMAAEQIAAVLESDVNLFACGVGAPPAAVAAAKRGGKTTLALVGSARHAASAVRAGADIIVAQGYDAGAHTGPIGTFSVVPQVVAAVGDVPVLAAGGIATGQHLAAALALGAVGGWVGTAWLTTLEHKDDLPPKVLAKLLAATSEDTVITRADSGKTLRTLRSAWSDEWEAKSAPVPLKMPYQDILVGDLLGAIKEHQWEPLLSQPTGQGIAWFNEMTSVAEVIDNLVGGAVATLDRLGGLRRDAAAE